MKNLSPEDLENLKIALCNEEVQKQARDAADPQSIELDPISEQFLLKTIQFFAKKSKCSFSKKEVISLQESIYAYSRAIYNHIIHANSCNI